MSLCGSVRIRIRNTALLKYVFSGGTAIYGILIQYRYSLLMIVRADTSSLIMLFLSPSGPGVFILHLAMSHEQFGFGEKNKCTHKKKIATKWQENNNVVKYFLLKVEGNMCLRNGKYTYIFMPLLMIMFFFCTQWSVCRARDGDLTDNRSMLFSVLSSGYSGIQTEYLYLLFIS